MKKLLLLFVLLGFGCSENETAVLIEEVLPKNSIEIEIDGQKVESDIVSIDAFYSCDKTISVNVSSKKNRVTSELFRIVLLKDGQLIQANFVDKENAFSNIKYRTPDYIPSSTLKIEAFEFVENEKLYLKFSGSLLKQIHNLFDDSEEIKINGIVEVKEFGKSICSYFSDTILLNDEIKFFNISKISRNSAQNKNIIYEATSLNGYNIQFKNFTEWLPNMALGTYNFDANTLSEKIEFKKYIGTPKFFSSNSNFVLPTDWENYETKGSFTILEKEKVDRFDVVKVKINFTASYNGIIEYNFTDAVFETRY